MSASVWIAEDYDGGYVGSITYNLGPMLRAAGFPHWDELKGAPTSEVGGVVFGVRARMLANPEKYEAMNPSNGWGDFRSATDWLRRLIEVCTEYPDGHLEWSL